MKVGRRLQQVIDAIESRGLVGQAVFVSRVGMPDERIETDLRRLCGAPEETGYLSIVMCRRH